MKKLRIITVIAIAIVLCGCAGNVKEGKAFLEEEKYEEARACFEKDIEKGKNLDKAYYGKGIACFELEEYETAMECLKEAAKEGTKEDSVFCDFLGACYIETEQYKEAIEVYKKALEDEKISEELKQETRYNLIVAYEKSGDWDAAKKEMKNYEKDYPEDTRLKRESDFLETR